MKLCRERLLICADDFEQSSQQLELFNTTEKEQWVMESYKIKYFIACFAALFLLIARAEARKLLSVDEKKQKLVRLLANSVAMNLTTEVKTNGVENILVLNPWTPAEVFFEVTHAKMPLTIFIDLACHATLHWRVSLLELSDIENVWRSVEISKPQGQAGPKAFLHVRNSHSNGLSVALATYETEDSQIFTLHTAPKGFYRIDMRSSTRFSQVVKVSVLVGGTLDLHIPSLPSDNQVSLAQISNDYFNFYWQPVDINDSARKDEIRYCVAINSNKYVNHLCEMQDMLRRSPHSVKAFSCFGGPNWYQLRGNLNPAKFYFVNLFAVNQYSNRSRSYRGLFMPRARHSRMTRLGLDSSLNLRINKKSSYHVIYFDVKTSGTLRITFVACQGPVSVFVAKNGKVLKQLEFGSMKSYLLKSAEVGRYFVTVTKKFTANLHLRVHLSGGKRWGPFPRIPKGISVKEWPMLRTCKSVTIAWIAGHGKQQFCLFVGRESLKATKHLQNVCLKPGTLPGNRMVICLDKRIRKGENAVFWRTIKGLQPCSEYIFYIQVKRRRSDDTLIYKPLKVRTLCRKCLSNY